MSDKTHAQLYTKSEFIGLTRDAMYQALVHVSPALSKGMSRAKKEELVDLYWNARGWAESSREEAETKVIVVGDGLTQMKGLQPDVVLHDDELVRVNPEMPSSENGELQLPSEGEAMFTFKDGPRELTGKDQHLLKALNKSFKTFCANPADRMAKAEVYDTIYALKVRGIIANPKFAEVVKSGRAQVREVRKRMRANVNPQAPDDGAQPSGSTVEEAHNAAAEIVESVAGRL